MMAGGGDPNARNRFGETPWYLAQENPALDGSDVLQRLNPRID